MLEKVSQTILNLLAAGQRYADAADAIENVRDAESAAHRAIAYFDAANALLTGFGELHNQLIEHPQFIAARSFSRKWR